jgi:DNA-binding response OmpR family regulator
MSDNEFEVYILLLVEDSDDDVILTQRKLYKSSLKITRFVVAKNLKEGIEYATSLKPDVVLLDLNLPETQGLNTLDEFRKVYDGIVIVVTSLDDEMTGVEAIRKGADDYLVKGSMTENLLLKTIIYARERRKLKSHFAAVKDKLEQLDKIAGV